MQANTPRISPAGGRKATRGRDRFAQPPILERVQHLARFSGSSSSSLAKTLPSPLTRPHQRTICGVLWLNPCHQFKLRSMTTLCHDHPTSCESVAPSFLCSGTHTHESERAPRPQAQRRHRRRQGHRPRPGWHRAPDRYLQWIGQLLHLEDPNYNTLRLRLEIAHAAVEAATVEARRRVRLNEGR
jgi:hypothetical protein